MYDGFVLGILGGAHQHRLVKVGVALIDFMQLFMLVGGERGSPALSADQASHALREGVIRPSPFG